MRIKLIRFYCPVIISLMLGCQPKPIQPYIIGMASHINNPTEIEFDVDKINAFRSQIDSTDIESEPILDTKYPNPFCPQSTFDFNIEEKDTFSITIATHTGKMITLNDVIMEKGSYFINMAKWDLPSGHYFIIIKNGNNINLVRKFYFLK